MLESTDRRSIAEATSEELDTRKPEWSAPELTTFGDVAALTETGGQTNVDQVGMLS